MLKEHVACAIKLALPGLVLAEPQAEPTTHFFAVSAFERDHGSFRDAAQRLRIPASKVSTRTGYSFGLTKITSQDNLSISSVSGLGENNSTCKTENLDFSTY